jgi:hypothetical protein
MKDFLKVMRALSDPSRVKSYRKEVVRPESRPKAQSPTEADAIVHYRRVRDEIRRFVEELPEVLLEEGRIK